MNPDDLKLRKTLQGALPSPPLPPRFQESVWRRIENAEIPLKTESWLDTFASLILRPRFAYTTVVMLALAGILLGSHQGAQSVKHDEQERYLMLVAPNSLR